MSPAFGPDEEVVRAGISAGDRRGPRRYGAVTAQVPTELLVMTQIGQGQDSSRFCCPNTESGRFLDLTYRAGSNREGVPTVDTEVAGIRLWFRDGSAGATRVGRPGRQDDSGCSRVSWLGENNFHSFFDSHDDRFGWNAGAGNFLF